MSNTSAATKPRQSTPRPAPPPIPRQCDDCGHTFEPASEVVTPRCPRCGSARCRDTQRRVAGSLLSAANPVEEDRFARVALWGDLITSEQFAQCVEEQKAHAAAGHRVPSLPQLLIEKGYIRREHADAIFRVMTTSTAEQWRNQFGQIALRKEMITEEQLREGLEHQTRLIMSTGSAPFLGHLLIERGYMSEAQVLAILKAQLQRRIGMLHELESALRPASSRVAAALRSHPRVLWGLVFAVGLVAAGLVGARLHAYASAPPVFDLLCDQCGHRGSAPARAIARPCPRCGKGQMCTPLRCAPCRVVFPLHVHCPPDGGTWLEACPKCGSLDHVRVPEGLKGLPCRLPEARAATP